MRGGEDGLRGRGCLVIVIGAGGAVRVVRMALGAGEAVREVGLARL